MRLPHRISRTVMLAEGADLPVDVRVVPVGLGDRGFEVIDHEGLGHPAEMPEGILQAANEVLRRLTVDHLAIGLADRRDRSSAGAIGDEEHGLLQL